LTSNAVPERLHFVCPSKQPSSAYHKLWGI
jgi:hypothetical protein